MDTLYNQFDLECPFATPDLEKSYHCSNYIESSGMTLLMKWVLQTKKKPEFEKIIKNYLKKHPDQIDLQNERGHTALLLASFNTNTVSTENTVKILIDAGADINIIDKNHHDALLSCCSFSNSDSTDNTVKMLIDAGANVFSSEIQSRIMFKNYIRGTESNATKRSIKMLINLCIDCHQFNIIKETIFYLPICDTDVREFIMETIKERVQYKQEYNLELPHVKYLFKDLIENLTNGNFKLMKDILDGHIMI